MPPLYNANTTKRRRRTLRQNMPEPENRLWYYLRNRRCAGLKFKRQYSIGKYVLDFYCPEKKMAIEIDGDTHYQNQEIVDYDRKRQQYIECFGIRVLRYTNEEVMKNIEGVLEDIVR